MSSARVKVEALVSGRNTPSSRFRVLQHVAPLGALGVEVRARPPRINKYTSVPDRWAAKPLVAPLARRGLRACKLAVRLPATARSWLSDVTWLEREVLPGSLTLEPVLGRPLVFDVDDAIWLLSAGDNRAARAIAKRAACVTAGNDFLADWFSQHAPAVERVWTAVDTDRFVARPPADEKPREWVVGWTGSRSTSRYLQSIEPALSRFFTATRDTRLVLVSDVAPVLKSIPPDRVEFVAWSPETEARVLQRFDVGLMPLPDTDWARGKCAMKMLQYLSCAVPAVVSNVGMGEQVLAMADVGAGVSNLDEWTDALRALHADREAAASLGASGRRLVESSFSLDVITPQIAAIMRRYL